MRRIPNPAFYTPVLSEAGVAGESILSATHPDLLFYYTMDNISGSTLVDESANGNDGTISGAAQTTSSGGHINEGLQFTGASDKVVLPTTGIITLTSGAVSAWVNPVSIASGSNWILSTAYNAQNVRFFSFGVEQTTGKVFYSQRDNDTQDQGTTGTALSTSTFSHVVCQSTGTTIEIYINGGSSETITFTSGANNGDWFGDVTAVNAAELGTLCRSSAIYSDDMILDDVRLFSRVLTADEIAELYAET